MFTSPVLLFSLSFRNGASGRPNKNLVVGFDTDESKRQRLAWQSLFSEVDLPIKVGRGLLAIIAKWWQGDTLEIKGRLTPAVKYKVTKEDNSNEGLLIFNIDSKVIVASITHTNQNTIILNAYMFPELEK